MRDYTIQLAGKDIPARGLWNVLFHKEKPDSAAESHFRDRCSELLNLAAAIQEAEGNQGNMKDLVDLLTDPVEVALRTCALCAQERGEAASVIRKNARYWKETLGPVVGRLALGFA